MKQATGRLLALECAAVGSGILALAFLGNALLIGAAIFGLFSAALFQSCERQYRKQQHRRACCRQAAAVSCQPALRIQKDGGSTAA